VVRFFEEVWSPNKLCELDEYIPVDLVHHNGIMVLTGRGPDDVRQLIQIRKTGFPDFQYHILELSGGGETFIHDQTTT